MWDVARREHHCARRRLNHLVADRKSHLALDHIESFVFPVVDVSWRNISFSGALLHQRELPVRLLTRREERQQPAAIPDRPVERLSSAAKCAGRLTNSILSEIGRAHV